MECVANFEVKTEGSVAEDGRVLKIQHPLGLFRARIENIPRSVYTTPFLLSLHLYFSAPSLHGAQELAEGHLVECLNMLVLTTGLRFQKHRIRQIVDTTQEANGMRTLLMWSDSIEYEDPEPFLDERVIHSIERLLEYEAPAPIRRAMRWYRLGVAETVPDDQFMNFWFALEIVAEYQKSPQKVPSNCPRCRTPLYCATCETHPTHRPFAKQAIRDLLRSVDGACDDEAIDRLERTRNGLMHGATLKEMEADLPKPHEAIVDVLGRLLWRALMQQFPRETFRDQLDFGSPSTYVQRSLRGVAHMKTIVPTLPDGDLDLRFEGVKATVQPFGPPQSGRPTIIKMTTNQFQRLQKLSYGNDPAREMCRRICEQRQMLENGVATLALSTDMASIRQALARGDSGDWQDLFREILLAGDLNSGQSPNQPRE